MLFIGEIRTTAEFLLPIIVLRLYALERGFKYLVLLDQDTHFPSNAIDNYLALDGEVTLAAPRLVMRNGQPFFSGNSEHLQSEGKGSCSRRLSP